MRRLLLLVALVAALTTPIRAQEPQVASVTMPPTAYGVEAFFWLPRVSAMRVLLPSGDTLWVGNLVDVTEDKACAHSLPAVQRARLRVRVPGDTGVTVEFVARERGRGAQTPNFALPLRDGSTFKINEIYRRWSRCGDQDGLLIIWLQIDAPKP